MHYAVEIERCSLCRHSLYRAENIVYVVRIAAGSNAFETSTLLKGHVAVLHACLETP